MKRKFLLLYLLFLFSACGCRHEPAVFDSFSGYTQGTTYSIVYQSKRNITPEVLKASVEVIFAKFDMSLSLYKDSSIISRINRNENAVPDSFFTEVFRKSAIVSGITGGYFDITVGPLVEAWGFGPDAHKTFSESKRDSLMEFIGMDKVSLVNGRLVKSDPGIKLDVNAIAQGFSVDVICRYFDKLGIGNYLVEIGGEVRAKGKRDGNLWRIGIDRPTDNSMSPGEDLEAIIRITDKALATSGNYRKFYIENGVKYSHTIDPLTGYPAKNTLLSATIIADDCAMADGIATACMVMGKDKSIEFLNNNHQFRAYLIFSNDKGNYETWFSPSMEGQISETGIE
jgi:thiamine biosynthesis lipoprotein